MKVLEVASSLFEWGGIERYVHFLDEGLSELGHEVIVACPTGSPLDQKSARDVLIANRAKYSPRTLLAFYRIGKQLSPDIAHIHFSPDFIVPAVALKRSCSAKLVMTRHLVLPWKRRRVRRYRALYDHIIPVSNAVQEALNHSGIPKSMMTVAKAGVAVCPELTACAPHSELIVGSFGRLVPEKGVDLLIDAVQGLDGIKVRIYGDGPARRDLERTANEKGVASQVEFCGHVGNVMEAMSDVDVVCVPSRWNEAFPYSVLEAMSLGKPVVGARSGGIPEVVVEGETGWLFEKEQSAELAQVLSRLRKDRANLAKIGERAREIQRSEYTIPKMAERIEAVFRKVLESR